MSHGRLAEAGNGQRVFTFFSHKGEGPSEDIHEVGQPVRVWRAVELPDVHHIVLVLQHSRCSAKREQNRVEQTLQKGREVLHFCICKRLGTMADTVPEDKLQGKNISAEDSSLRAGMQWRPRSSGAFAFKQGIHYSISSPITNTKLVLAVQTGQQHTEAPKPRSRFSLVFTHRLPSLCEIPTIAPLPIHWDWLMTHIAYGIWSLCKVLLRCVRENMKIENQKDRETNETTFPKKHFFVLYIS